MSESTPNYAALGPDILKFINFDPNIRTPYDPEFRAAFINAYAAISAFQTNPPIMKPDVSYLSENDQKETEERVKKEVELVKGNPEAEKQFLAEKQEKVDDLVNEFNSYIKDFISCSEGIYATMSQLLSKEEMDIINQEIKAKIEEKQKITEPDWEVK